MKQQIIKIGNSAGVVIPKALRDQLGLKPGSKIVIEGNQDNAVIIRKKDRTGRRSSPTPEFMKALSKVNKRYGPALRELAQK